ncbi:MAG: hypothetical protein NYU39_02280 [Aigarchaeota archaeon]|nr:hypothetical protein [Candidatus Caldarchaeales archaeon]MDJ0273067.1 hypothetical protein [Candidatus Caldarchaeales archaeon]
MNKTSQLATATLLIITVLLSNSISWAEEKTPYAKSVSEYVASFAAEGIELPNITAYVQVWGQSRDLSSLRRLLEFLWNVYQTDPQTGRQGVMVLEEIYGLRIDQRLEGMASYLLDAAEQLLQQETVSVLEGKTRDSFTKASVLVEAVGNVLKGRGVDVRVIKGGEEDRRQMEVSIATVTTSRGEVKIYVTQEAETYSNQTVTFSRSIYISLGNTIIIQKETERSLQPSEQEKQLMVGENIGIGAILSLRKTNAQKQLEKTEYDVKVVEHGFDRGFIRLVLTSDSSEQGRLIILDVDKSIQREYFPRDVSVRVNGEPAKLASSVSEVLSGELDKPAYFLAVTGGGLEIVLYIPSWSTKVVLIGSSSSLSYLISIPSLLGRENEFTATTLAAALLVIALVASRLKRTK